MYFNVLFACVYYYANYREAYGLYGGEENYQDAMHQYNVLSTLAEFLGKDVKVLIDFYRISNKLNIGFSSSDNDKLKRIFYGLS